MKNISLAIIAILAIAMTSCNTNPIGGSVIDSHSKNWQTPTSQMVFEGVVKTAIIDHEMIATDLVIGGISSAKGYDSIYAYVADSDYKMAVAMNDAIIRGYKLRVHMVERWYWFRFRMRIIDYSIITNTVQKTKTKPDTESRETIKPKKRIRKYVPAPVPVVVPTQPCCCETVTINGNINITVVDQEEKQKSCIEPERKTTSPEEKIFLKNPNRNLAPPLKQKEPMTYPWN